MPRKCVLCGIDDELRSKIEQFVADGGTYVSASKYSKENGLDVSHTSIQRHIENHTQIESGSEKNEGYGSEMEAIAKPINGSNWRDIESQLNGELREILGNLTAICNSKLKAYMAGESRFPKDEMKSLQDIYNMLNRRGDVIDTVSTERKALDGDFCDDFVLKGIT